MLLFFATIQVLLLTLFLSLCCKGLDLDDDTIDEDEEKAIVADESQWKRKSRFKDNSSFYPIDEAYLEKMRAERIEEVILWNIVHEIISFGLFILTVYFISYGNRDPMSFTLKNQVEEAFITNPGFDQIISSNDLWDWIHTTAVPALRAQSMYNGMPAYGMRGFMGDRTNRMMGYGILRQVRVTPNTCPVAKTVQNITQECAKVFLVL